MDQMPYASRPFAYSSRSRSNGSVPSYSDLINVGSSAATFTPPAGAPMRAPTPPQAPAAAPQVLRRNKSTAKKNEAPKAEGATPLKPSRAEKRAKFVQKWTSNKGLAKLGLNTGLVALAGAGAYYGVTAIIHAIHVGVSAKVGSLLLPIGATIGATLLFAVVARAAYKGVKKMNKAYKAKAAKAEEARMKQFLANQKTGL